MRQRCGHLPAEDTKNEVHHKECTKDDHGYKKDPLPAVTHGISNLWRRKTRKLRVLEMFCNLKRRSQHTVNILLTG